MKHDALIPSMFHRRLTLLVACVVVGMLGLVGQLYRLTVVQGAEHREQAERLLVDRELLPTYRGRILDRHGEVLALDRPCFDIMVDYRLISGEWAQAQAASEARRTHRETWDQLSRADRGELIARLVPQYERQVFELWEELARLGDIEVREVLARKDAIRQRVESMARFVWERWREQREKEYQTTVTIDEVRRPIREQRQPHAILTRIDPARETAFRALAARGPQIGRDRPAVTVRASGTRDYPWESTQVVLDRSFLPTPLRHAVENRSMGFQPVRGGQDVSHGLEAHAPGYLHRIRVEHFASQIVGAMRSQIYEEELADRPLRGRDGSVLDLGGYSPDDEIGSTGVEQSMERDLRGRRGMIVRYYDGRPEERVNPVPGGDVQLTLDIRLQARVAAILDPEFGLTRVQPWHGVENELPIGTPLAAGAVVLDVRSGEILALVSSPTAPRPEIVELLASLPADWNADDGPLSASERARWRSLLTPQALSPQSFNLAARWPYPPGSIVKPLFLASAASQRQWDVHKSVTCNGHFFAHDPESLRCWVYRPPALATHGPLGPVEAIARSCNIFFYTIGQVLGPAGVAEVYRDWGVGRDFDLGIPASIGMLHEPTPDQRSVPMMMGIGQGPVAWTPLHAVAAYAALARGGLYITPTLIRGQGSGVRGQGGSTQALTPSRIDLALNDEAVYLALRGLWDVVNNTQHGGARQIDIDPPHRQFEPIFNAPGAKVWGKTGTAQQRWPTRILRYLPDGSVVRDASGRPMYLDRESGTGSHSWFVGMVAREAASGPEYAIAVLVEWGGSGSRGAGPIANQIMHALRVEGYLP